MGDCASEHGHPGLGAQGEGGVDPEEAYVFQLRRNPFNSPSGTVADGIGLSLSSTAELADHVICCEPGTDKTNVRSLPSFPRPPPV